MCAVCAAYAATAGKSALIFIISSEVQTIQYNTIQYSLFKTVGKGEGEGEQMEKHANEKFYGKF